MKRFCKLVSDYMGVLVLLSALAALLFPDTLSHLKPRLINPLLGIIMFGMGLTLKAEDFKVVFSRPRDVLVGCLAQFTVMPLLAFVLTKVFRLEPTLAIGVILVGCCPGGTASNVITYLAKGDLALSVGMTAVSTLLAPVLTPLLVWLLAGETVDVDVLVKRFWPRTTEQASAYLPALSTLAICVIVLIVIAANAHKLLDGGLVILLVVVLHNVCGLGAGYLIGTLLHLAPAKRRAISVEVGMQNSGLASSLATLHFAAYPLATIPGALFSVWHNISGAIVAKLYSRNA